MNKKTSVGRTAFAVPAALIRITLSVTLAFILGTTAWAQRIGEGEALRRAEAFLQHRDVTRQVQRHLSHAAKSRGTAADDSAHDYYVFNIGSGKGFVIVSGDERAADILGYADQGSFDPDNTPDGLQYMLDGYAGQIAALGASDGSPAPRKASAARTPVAPMVSTHWWQVTPYNHYCPEVNGTACATGCVATAMAQVMYFHKWPTGSTTSIPGYTSRNGLHKNLAALDPIKFNWSAMTSSYSSTYSGTDAETAVARLMQYCGWSLQMNYNASSSAYNAAIADALKTHFGYDGSASFVQRHHYTYQQWVDLIYSELAAGRPVILGGQSMGGGHSFVCDGYDTDDYFHINWGWGGNDDGYYRLSALNPEEQGEGGSSSLDGFSFKQDAVVGIHPSTGTDQAVRPSLERLQFDAAGSTTSQTVTRTTESAPFSGISLYYSLCNYSYTASTYDYAVVLSSTPAPSQVCDGTAVFNPVLSSSIAEYTVLKSSTGEVLSFNVDKNTSTSDLTIPALTDGTYYINVVGRPAGSTDWLYCYDSPQQQITARVSGNNLTLTTPFVSGTGALPSAVAFTVDGNQTKGYEQTVTASVTGGTVDYTGNLILRVDGTSVMGKSVEIPAGKTIDVTFTYIPSTAGTNTLTLWSDKSGGLQIGTGESIAIAESDATNDLNLTFNVTIDNLAAPNQLYGRALRATVEVANPSTTNTYVGRLACSTRLWTGTDNGDNTTTWSWESIDLRYYPLTVDKEGNAVVHIYADNLPADGRYSFRLTYLRNTADGNVADAVHLGLDNDGIGSITVKPGYSLGDASGNTTIHPASTYIEAASACYVDLRDITPLSAVTINPSSNPNCVYLIAEGEDAPSSLSGLNVVKGSTAATLTLTDDDDFFTPVAFTATEASYTRTFTLRAAGTSGWSTLMLPFTATKVTVAGSTAERTWFRSDSDEEGSFWLRAFTADAEGSVTFSHAQSLTANTPYIIAVPGTTWGTEWQMTDRPVTFSASNVTITAMKSETGEHIMAPEVSGSHYKFVGTTVAQNVDNVYVLNTQGSKFTKVKKSTPVEPFRAWFTPITISSLTLPSLSIAAPGASAIHHVGHSASTNVSWHTLDGRRLNARPTAAGMYISNGKVVIIK